MESASFSTHEEEAQEAFPKDSRKLLIYRKLIGMTAGRHLAE